MRIKKFFCAIVLVALVLAGCGTWLNEPIATDQTASSSDQTASPSLDQVASPYVEKYGEPTNKIFHVFGDATKEGDATQVAIYEWYIEVPISSDAYRKDMLHEVWFATDKYHRGWYVVKTEEGSSESQ
ncbi:MAG TPA: hypothetical protein VMD05_07995 [Candidatus Nanoarchaeia archaeon]|nr:hypothetical protein [Candidatus Nanoarchaeia archaeon]